MDWSEKVKEWCVQQTFKHINGKQSNPKDSVGIKKVPFSTVPAPVMAEIGLAMLEGARKYGKYNWRTVGVRASVYYDACLRHLTEWHEGVDIDRDSGLSNITKAMACLVVLRDSELVGNISDDRPPRYPDDATNCKEHNWLWRLNEKAAELIEKYPESKEAHTHVKSQLELPI